MNAALATTAILLKLESQWVPLALLLEAELYYLAGVRFRSAYLRTLAGVIFSLELAVLLIADVGKLPPHTWEPVAALNVLAFYLNRALQVSEVWYGYAAAAMAALITGFEIQAPWRERVWTLMAIGPFAFGWWRRLFDFRVQGYGLALARSGRDAVFPPYTAALVRHWQRRGLRVRPLHSVERTRSDWAIRNAKPCALRHRSPTTLGAVALVWRVVPGEYLGIAWLGLALLMLEAGLRDLPMNFACRHVWSGW